MALIEAFLVFVVAPMAMIAGAAAAGLVLWETVKLVRSDVAAWMAAPAPVRAEPASNVVPITFAANRRPAAARENIRRAA
jgi:hypothetical protein